MTISGLWKRYLDAYRELTLARMAIAGHDDNLVECIRTSLLAGGWESPAALSLVPYLAEQAASKLLEPLISVALSVHGDTEVARTVLASMPRLEVVRALGTLEPQIIARNDFEEWGCLMHLWDRLGEKQRAEDMAHRGLASTEEDIRDVATRFLQGRTT